MRTEYVPVYQPQAPDFIPCKMPNIDRLPDTIGGLVAAEKELKWAIKKCNKQNIHE